MSTARNQSTDIDTIVSEAIALRDADDFEGAIALIRNVIDLSPASAYSALILGQLLAESGDLPAAGRWLKHALDNNRDDLHARMAYGTWLSQSGSPDEGLAMLLAVADDVGKSFMSNDHDITRDELIELTGIRDTVIANIARTQFVRGEIENAREIASAQLADADNWEWAHDLFSDIVEHEMEQDPGFDLMAVTMAGLESGKVSPFMVLHAIETVMDGEPIDFIELESIVARADDIFDFDWRNVDPAVVDALASVRTETGRAIMRGLVKAVQVPSLLVNE